MTKHGDDLSLADLPDIGWVKDADRVPEILAPAIARYGVLFLFSDDVTGYLFVSRSAAAQPGAELLYKIGPRGSLGVRRTGAKVYAKAYPSR